MRQFVFHASMSLFFMVILWQAVITIFHLPNYILPTPKEVLLTLLQLSPTLLPQAWITLYETLAGLLLGGFFGILSAILLMAIQPLRLFLLPLLLLSQAIPIFAIAPLLVLWFGFGVSSKIIIVIFMVFFPMTCTLFNGLNKTPTEYLEMANHMRGKKIHIMRYIYLPFALPYFASGLRISATIAPLGAIIGEWVGASQGLGYMMLNANARLETNTVFATLCVLVFITLSLYTVIDRMLKRWITW